MDEDGGGLILLGRNAALEAINHNKPVDRLLIKKGAEGTLKVIAAKARERGIVVQEASAQKLAELSMGGNHQGVIALCPAKEYAEPEDMLACARERAEDPFIVILDEITDPHNLGAIIRCAEAAGAHGVVIPKRRAAGLTATVAKASSGAIEHILISRVTNIGDSVDYFKSQGLWAVSAVTGGASVYETNLTGPVAVVIGSEGSGVKRLVCEKSDFTVGIPMRGRVGSLNASVAAGVIFFEIIRQRSLK